MNRQTLKKRIRLIQRSNSNDGIMDAHVRAKHKNFFPLSEENRQRMKKLMPILKHAILSSAFGVATFFPITAASPNTVLRTDDKIMAEQVRSRQIERIVDAKAKSLQKEIIYKTDSLQKLIKNAPPIRKNKIISEIFNGVYKNCGFNAKFNYCVAGAMYVRFQCQDKVLNALLPDPTKRPKDYYPEMGNHPNVVCTTMEQFFKDRYGENYAEKGMPNFTKFLSTLEAGDIITISSHRNTSTGRHCLTCAGPLKNGLIPVKSFNGEKDYQVSVAKITFAAKVINQYRRELTRQLETEMDIKNFMPVLTDKKSQLSFNDFASVENFSDSRKTIQSEISPDNELNTEGAAKPFIKKEKSKSKTNEVTQIALLTRQHKQNI